MDTLVAAALVGSLVACSATVTDDAAPVAGRDAEPPVLTIESPARGTTTAEPRVEVVGEVRDASGVAEVRINDQVASLTGDRFSLELTGQIGLNLITITATDMAGNVATDHRAVLAGATAPQGTPIDDGVVARIDPTALFSLGTLLTRVASETNLMALVANPVVNTGNSCNDAQAYVDSITTSGVPVTVGPTGGGIAAQASVRDIVVRGSVQFRALCVSGSAGFTITAVAFDLGGRIRPELVGEDIVVAMDGVNGNFVGFALQVGAIPSFVTDLIEGQVRDRVASAISGQVQAVVPPMVNDFLADFVRSDYAVAALGREIDVSIAPTAMRWEADGGRVAMRASTAVRGVEGADYLSTPMPAPDGFGLGGLGVALADDLVNQLLASVWASGLFDAELALGAGHPLRAFFADADRLRYRFSLPPVVNADTTTGTMKLYVGDAMVELVDDDQGIGSIALVALSADLDLSATLDADGRFRVQTGVPRVLAQTVEQSVGEAMDPAQLAAFADSAIVGVATMADDLLTTIPLPGLPGAALTAPTFEPRAGYLMLGGQLAVP